MDAVEVRADPVSFGRVAAALGAESDGREWNADLAATLHAALEPAVAEVRSALMGASTGGLDYAGEPLRQAIAAHTTVDVRLGDGPGAGARIRALKRGLPRRFWNAPARFNAPRFRRRVYGRDVWVTQVGAPGWFDDTLDRRRAKLRAAVLRALDNRAQRIARRS